MRPIYLQSLIYADDITLIAESEEQLQYSLGEWPMALEQRGMFMNCKKSKVLEITRSNQKNEYQDKLGNLCCSAALMA